MRKNIFYILAFWIIMASLAVFLLTPNVYSPNNPLPEQISRTTKIILDKENSIEKINGIWSSVENDLYPVDNELVENLLTNLRQASVHASKSRLSPSDRLKITLEDTTQQAVELFISPQKSNIIALYNQKYYSFSGEIKIPSQPYQWFAQPLLPIPDNLITSIKGVDKDKFSFAKLTFLQATKENDFGDWPQKEISIKTEDGITIVLTIYTKNHSYWLSARLGTTIMPTIEAKKHLNDNQFLYNGWYFELPQPIGNELFSD